MARERDEDDLFYDLGHAHWAEVLQAVFMVQSNLQSFVVEHPAIIQTPALAGKAEVINRLLGELYQAIGEVAAEPGEVE